MTLYQLLVSFLDLIFSPLTAWRLDSAKESPALQQLRRQLIDTLPSNSALLEIGAGTGATLEAAAYEGPVVRFSRLVLVEPDRAMRARLETKLEPRVTAVQPGHVQLVDAALPNLPFQNAEFDAVILFYVASHLQHRPAAIKEIVRVLKPGANLLLIDHGIHHHEHHEHHENLHHTAVVEATRPVPFWMEWFRFWKHGGHMHSDLDKLVHYFEQEHMLEKMYTSRMKVELKLFDEIVYGCFVRRNDPE